jgi:arylsulfatase A-like enzyme
VVFLALAVTALIIISQVNCGKKAPEPNVVLIVIDTLRADHLPFYGYKKNTAPFLSEIASRSVVFDNTFSVSSWTASATASIFTSLYPIQHGVILGYWASRNLKIEFHRIPAEIKTIPEVMKEKGYKTYGTAANVNICEKQGFTQGFDKFELHRYGEKSKLNKQLKKWAEEIKSGGKYFLYIHYNDPHLPYHKRAPWYKKKKGRTADKISRYDSEINHVDQKIKEMYELFGWDKNTLLIVAADHGEEFMEHKGSTHANTLYSEVLRVPFMICFPGEDQVYKRIKHNVCTIDILPTMKDYLDIEDGQFTEGLSQMPVIRGEKKESNQRYFYPYLRTQKNWRHLLRATIWDDWKYIFSNKNKKELYNLKDDPGEKANIYEDNKNLTGQLFFRYSEFEKKCKKFKWERKKGKLSSKKIKELQTLGYVE